MKYIEQIINSTGSRRENDNRRSTQTFNYKKRRYDLRFQKWPNRRERQSRAAYEK